MPEIEAFVDWGFEGPDFARQLLGGPDFREPDLRRLAAEDAKLAKGKSALGSVVADRWIDGRVSDDELLECLVAPYRKWLAIRLGKRKALPQLGNPAELLGSFGEEKWYGPFGPRGEWYVRPFRLTHIGDTTGAGKPRRGSVRWLVYAQVRREAILYCWDGFTTKTSREARHHLQFPFWDHLPGAMAELEKELTVAGAGKHTYPKLHSLVLHQLWDRYINDAQYRWHHLKINADAYGVALNAKSAPVELSISGLDNLSQQLARSSMRALDLNEDDAEQRKPVELELMRTLLRNWGAHSYEFQLDEVDRAGKAQPRMRANCYFGLQTAKVGTQVAFQHIHCYARMKGAIVAGEFFLKHLGIAV